MDKTKLYIQGVLDAYAHGLFPMAQDREDTGFYWFDPPHRGQLSIENLHIPARLRRSLLQFPYAIKINTAFEQVIHACAEPAPNRPQSWINQDIATLFLDLHKAGFAHSIEAWQKNTLVGGLYGLALGGAFMGESMFSRARDASKIALVHLCARLWKGGFVLLDTQYVNDHLKQFGAYEIPRTDYLEKLTQALKIRADFILAGQDEKSLVLEYSASHIK